MPDPTPSIDIDTSNATVPAPVYVYEAPIRLWHWTTAVVFFCLVHNWISDWGSSMAAVHRPTLLSLPDG